MLTKHIGRGGIVFGRNNDHRASIPPLPFKRQDLIRHGEGAVNQDAIRPRLVIGLRPPQGFGQSPTADERFDPGNDAEIRV